jgi:hypothetical protein
MSGRSATLLDTVVGHVDQVYAVAEGRGRRRR